MLVSTGDGTMGRHYAEIAFTPAVQAAQARIGSQRHFARVAAEGREDSALGEAEVAFLHARDSFYLATVSETGWPYLQHRGGPPGFVHVLDAWTIGFADLTGNRQHVSLGNLAGNDRVALFFMDYANRRRLKLLGRLRADTDPALTAKLVWPEAAHRAERAMLVTVEGFEWNCPQHITPRFTAAEWVAVNPA